MESNHLCRIFSPVHTPSLPKAQKSAPTLPGMTGAEPPRASRMAAVGRYEQPRPLSGAGSLYEILVELNPAARVREVVAAFRADAVPLAFQSAHDLSQLRSSEFAECLLNGKAPAEKKVQQNLFLRLLHPLMIVVCCHIVEVLSFPKKPAPEIH